MGSPTLSPEAVDYLRSVWECDGTLEDLRRAPHYVKAIHENAAKSRKDNLGWTLDEEISDALIGASVA